MDVALIYGTACCGIERIDQTAQQRSQLTDGHTLLHHLGQGLAVIECGDNRIENIQRGRIRETCGQLNVNTCVDIAGQTDINRVNVNCGIVGIEHDKALRNCLVRIDAGGVDGDLHSCFFSR